jgi:twitching motility protein PilT
MAPSIQELLQEMVQQGASDLHLKAGNLPGLRKDGKICLQEKFGVMSAEDVRTLAFSMMNPEQKETFENEGDLDLSYSLPGQARFRVNVLMQRETTGIVIRLIPEAIPTAEQLGLPPICLELSEKPRGLVLVTGPTGSGKSTTLAAMIDHINSTDEGHILTMEDPVEFIHQDKKSFVTQRQIGLDCKTFSQALRRALRQDPDVILIGEMRDLETISLAISAAETGHLVFGTLHTTSAISTVDRIIDVFPPDAQQQVRVQLSGTLQGVLSQCLIPKVGGGRIAARETLIATDAVRALVREGKTPQLLNLLQTGSKFGMSTLEQELVKLVNQGLITLEDAIGKANRPDEVERNAQPGTARAAGGGARMGTGRSPVGAGSGMGGTRMGSGERPAGRRTMRPSR